MGLRTVYTPENPIQDSTEEEVEDSDDEWSANAEGAVETSEEESGEEESGEEESGAEESGAEESGAEDSGEQEEQEQEDEEEGRADDPNESAARKDVERNPHGGMERDGKYSNVVSDATGDKSTRPSKRLPCTCAHFACTCTFRSV
jgi:hypothetical protein